jgi:hypothetical protein
MASEKSKAVAYSMVEAVKTHVTARLSPLETTIAQLEVRLAALEQKQCEADSERGADERLRAVK